MNKFKELIFEHTLKLLKNFQLTFIYGIIFKSNNNTIN